MHADAAHDQELVLKKRARRRLVGAVALVVLMLVILPKILQDRAVIQHESIKITMPDASKQAASVLPETQSVKMPEPLPQASPSEISDASIVSEIEAEQAKSPLPADTSIEKLIATKEAEEKNGKTALAKTSSVTGGGDKKTSTPADKMQQTDAAKLEAKVEKKNSEHFTVQIGVYSDRGNVKRLQNELKQAGYITTTEKVVTEKGESIRLKAGKFVSRQDAADALTKLKALGLSGIVVRAD